MASAFSLTGFVSWGLPLQIVEILKGYGHSVAFAIFAGTLMGPAQVIARLGEMTEAAHRVLPTRRPLMAIGKCWDGMRPGSCKRSAPT